MYRKKIFKEKSSFYNTTTIIVKERGGRKILFTENYNKNILQYKSNIEDYCDFCIGKCLNNTPERSSYTINHNNAIYRKYPSYSDIFNNPIKPDFRRCGNLFEIIPLYYWIDKYNYKLTKEEIEWRDSFINLNEGKEYIDNLLSIKFNRLGINKEDLDKKALNYYIDSIFGSCHELIISKKHYVDNAQYDNDYFFSGDFTLEEYRYLLLITKESIESIKNKNKFTNFICVFQNYLSNAGASFNHFHRQILALDFYGDFIKKEITRYKRNKSYLEYLIEAIKKSRTLIKEAENFVIFVEKGSLYPTLSIVSKSLKTPLELEDNKILTELSEILLKLYRILGRYIPCNEEWIYTPFDSKIGIPFRINIRLRLKNPAGFENITNYYVHPFSGRELADEIRSFF